MNVLVAYASKHGATAEIACFIAQRLRQKGHDVTVAQAGAVGDVDEFDSALIGGSIYGGRWPRDARRFVLDHATALRGMPTWLFSSGPAGDLTTDGLEPTCLPRLEAAISPIDHVTFNGRLEAARLSLGERLMMRATGAREGDFRNWGTIASWVETVAADLARRELRPTAG